MIITVELDKNKWLLSMTGEYNGHNINKRYRNKRKIKEFLLSLDSPNTVFIGINDMKLVYEDSTIILKKYRKNKKRYLYRNIVDKFDKNTKIINILSTNIDKFKNILFSKKSIAVAALSLSLAFSNYVNSDDEVPTTIEVSTVKQKNVMSKYQKNVENIFLIEDIGFDEIDVEEFNEIDVEEFDTEQYLSLDNRIIEIENIEYMDGNNNFNVCSKLDDYTLNKMISCMETDGETFLKAYNNYGVDPYLLLSIYMTETSLSHNSTIPGGSCYNGCAYGAMQIEKTNIGETITAYNYQNEQYDTITITEDKLIDFDSNIQIGAMLMQNCLEQYNNNIYIAIQAHNYGKYAMDMIIQKYADEVGKTFEEVTFDINDCGWFKYVDDMHNNPKNYFSKWKYSTYGNNKYIYNVLGYYMGQNIINNSKDNYYIYDLIENTCILQNKNQFMPDKKIQVADNKHSIR